MDKYIVCFDKQSADILSKSYELIYENNDTYYFENKPINEFDTAFFDSLNVITTNNLTMVF